MSMKDESKGVNTPGVIEGIVATQLKTSSLTEPLNSEPFQPEQTTGHKTEVKFSSQLKSCAGR